MAADQWYAKQIGPLPLGVWVGVVAAGVGVSVLVNRKAKGSGGTTAPASSDSQPSATDGAFGSLPAGTNLGGVVALPSGVPAGQVTYVDTSNPNGANSITDNIQWQRAAIDQLIALGYDPNLVDGAIRAYIAGQTLTPAQRSIVSLALQKIGSPPFPVFTLPSTTPPPSNNGGGSTAPPAPSYGPVYPASAALPVPSGVTCPPNAPVLIISTQKSFYTCATTAQDQILKQYLGLA